MLSKQLYWSTLSLVDEEKSILYYWSNFSFIVMIPKTVTSIPRVNLSKACQSFMNSSEPIDLAPLRYSGEFDSKYLVYEQLFSLRHNGNMENEFDNIQFIVNFNDKNEPKLKLIKEYKVQITMLQNRQISKSVRIF